MDKEILNVNEALTLLKEGVVLKDSKKVKFIYRKERIYIYSSNSSYSLNSNEFLSLYREKQFMVDTGDEEIIDSEKDREYYSFKHK